MFKLNLVQIDAEWEGKEKERGKKIETSFKSGLKFSRWVSTRGRGEVQGSHLGRGSCSQSGVGVV